MTMYTTTITNVSQVKMTKTGKPFTGIKLANPDIWVNIFSNKLDNQTLQGLNGKLVDIDLTQNGKWWNCKSISPNASAQINGALQNLATVADNGGFATSPLMQPATPKPQSSYQEQMKATHPPFTVMGLDDLRVMYMQETNGAARGLIDKTMQHVELMKAMEAQTLSIQALTIALTKNNELKKEQIELMGLEFVEEEVVEDEAGVEPDGE